MYPSECCQSDVSFSSNESIPARIRTRLLEFSPLPFQRSRAAGRLSDLHPHLMRTGTWQRYRLHQSTAVPVVAPLPSQLCSQVAVPHSPRPLPRLLRISSCTFSECDIVPRPSQRGQPRVTPFLSTHLCVMYCLLTCGSLAAPSGFGFVGVPTMRSKALLLWQ